MARSLERQSLQRSDTGGRIIFRKIKMSMALSKRSKIFSFIMVVAQDALMRMRPLTVQ
jgi:hypothetical protein